MDKTVANLLIGDFLWSSCDWRGRPSATILCQGCPWACPSCDRPGLRPVRGRRDVGWGDILAFLQGQRDVLSSIVFAGGEPTTQADLPKALKAVRSIGFETGPHTAGTHPERLEATLPLVDWVRFEIKAAFVEYDTVTRTAGSGAKAFESLCLILDSGVSFEARVGASATTLSPASLERLLADLSFLGIEARNDTFSNPASSTARGEIPTRHLL